MNKRVVFAVGAVLAFFGTAILVSELPSVATLGCFIATAAGFACGYFFRKDKDDEQFMSYEKEVASLEEELEAAKNSTKAPSTTTIKRAARK